jgi:hypothetical protein
MKISKIAVAALFAAGFVTIPASLGLAETQDQDDLMVIQCINEYTEETGYKCIETTPEDEAVANTTEVGDVDVKPIDSCWTNEDGSEVCARGITEPMPVSLEDVPVDGGDCTISTDPDGNELKACYDAVPYEVTGEEGEGCCKEGTVDESLMYQSGVTKSGATPNDQTASSTLAAFGVLVGALGALGIALSREKAAK